MKSIFSPGARLSGVAGFGSTVKSVEPMRRCTLVMTRSAAPTLETSIVEKMRRSRADRSEGEAVLKTDSNRPGQPA